MCQSGAKGFVVCGRAFWFGERALHWLCSTGGHFPKKYSLSRDTVAHISCGGGCPVILLELTLHAAVSVDVGV